MENLDHGGHDTWSMVHNLPNILNLIIEVMGLERGAWSGFHDFMTPQPIYSIKIFVSLCQELCNLMTPQGIYSVQIFVSLFQDFEQEFRSIFSQFEVKL